MMGHAALILPEPGARIGDLDFLFVDPKFRGKGGSCGLRLADFLLRTAEEKDLTGVYCYNVTVHTISQKLQPWPCCWPRPP